MRLPSCRSRVTAPAFDRRRPGRQSDGHSADVFDAGVAQEALQPKFFNDFPRACMHVRAMQCLSELPLSNRQRARQHGVLVLMDVTCLRGRAHRSYRLPRKLLARR